MISNRLLTYFLTVAKHGNITKAAEELHIPQPHLSTQLKLLEEELGVKLADRSTRMFRLTDAGRQFQYRAMQITDLMLAAKNELTEFEGGFLGSLKIGATTAASPILLPQKLSVFHNAYPKVDVEVKTLHTPEILDALEHGLIELGFLRNPIDSSVFDSFSFPPCPIVAVANSKFLNDAGKDALDITYLDGKPLIIISHFEPSFTEACKSAGFNPRFFCRIDDYRTALLCAYHGMGIAIIPKDILDIVQDYNLVYFDTGVSVKNTSFSIVWYKNRALTFVARNFMHLFIDDIY